MFCIHVFYHIYAIFRNIQEFLTKWVGIWYNGSGDFMKSIKIGVSELVRFIYASGDLESKNKAKEAMKIGQQLHLERQLIYGSADRKEVSVHIEHNVDDYAFFLYGRIDGVLDGDPLTLEEIKSTETALELIDETTYPAHLMQVKVYGHMYAKAHNLKGLNLSLCYIHHPSKKTKEIEKYYPASQLEKAFTKTLKAYMEWLDIYQEHQRKRNTSIEGLTFPHEAFREGQHPFMGAIYQTLIKEDILYATAPTGIGKTVAALYAALKTIKDDREKIFYLTAKNAAKSVAIKTVQDLKAKGLKIKALTLNSKDNMCLREEVDCDPEICPFAKGFYNRLNKALQDIFVHDDVFDIHLIKDYATYHDICPHEFALEIALYADIIICDYNYVFDPRIRLMRFFEENDYRPKLLVDEAHNLVDRSRSMYSAALSYQDAKTFRDETDTMKARFKEPLKKLIASMDSLIATSEVGKTRLFVDEILPESFMNTLNRLLAVLDEFMQTNKKHPKRKTVREFYFLLLQFSRISEFFDTPFRFMIEADADDYHFNILCFDASKEILKTIEDNGSGAVFFSATLKPTSYFAALLTKLKGKSHEIPSPFDPKRLGLFIDVSTSTKYHDRKNSVPRIIDSIYALLESKQGNYIVYFPSYAYMNLVLDQFDGSDYDVLVQKRGMSLFERQSMLDDFQENRPSSKVLFSVLGGSFSEGIDLIGEALSGVMIVGVALPAFNKLNELMRAYYDAEGYDGFHYAYTYPGMNKVIQAVGRVIRSEQDIGVAILLDQRYERDVYRHLFPLHWQHAEWLEEEDFLQGYLKQFWQEKMK